MSTGVFAFIATHHHLLWAQFWASVTLCFAQLCLVASQCSSSSSQTAMAQLLIAGVLVCAMSVATHPFGQNVFTWHPLTLVFVCPHTLHTSLSSLLVTVHPPSFSLQLFFTPGTPCAMLSSCNSYMSMSQLLCICCRHIVLAVRDSQTGRWGALGLSRRAELMEKPLTYASLADLLQNYIACYTQWWHSVLRIRIGLPIPHDVMYDGQVIALPGKAMDKLHTELAVTHANPSL